MKTAKWSFPLLILMLVAAAAIGFGASRFRDIGTMDRLTSERDLAQDCRRSGSSVRPCPVLYRNTRIVWRDKVEIVPAPDSKRAAQIARLSTELASARGRLGDLQTAMLARDRRRSDALWRRATRGYPLQNGTIGHPYRTSAKCAPGYVVFYEAPPSFGNMGVRSSGDPNVCYVRAGIGIHGNGVGFQRTQSRS
ncbi:MAG TPA: hypothetical protein VHX61_03740 [Rhizomicrobium sp.]|jgi:hypothetical protein|nr:hypothetical protein [Rhizomicrobium sp.]